MPKKTKNQNYDCKSSKQQQAEITNRNEKNIYEIHIFKLTKIQKINRL